MSASATEQETTVEIAKELGLLSEEFETIKTILGRIPNFTELSIYSVMWSEHCSYKNSIKWLKTLPREGSRLLAKAGEENAGLVDIGDGLACAFKIESHNHPSAIEPYQGAATGVGGIHRDIFTMGARPIASLNSLRFGNLSEEKTKHLLRGVVKGIGDYGNAFGVPTVAGEVFFDECYNTNPLVNAMSVGIVEVGKTVSAIAYGEGNPVFIVGSSTGKDGIHGASFASHEISEDSQEELPSVQVGDPFMEKLLLEASLEAIETGALIGMQDMGAAGITCSTSEMSAKGKHGMKIFLDRVPTRQQNMKPWEILLSESQERMLIVVEKGREQEVIDVYEKWDIHCEQIGEVVKGDRLFYYMHDELVADVPADSLVLGGGAPVYEREYTTPAYMKHIGEFHHDVIVEPTDLRSIAMKLISLPNIASKKWVTQQYDSMVGIANTSTNAPSDAAILRMKYSNKALAVKTDCNARYIHADPKKGAMIAVAEAARNIVCSGGIPVAITNCLNFGNPYNPEVYWQFVNVIQGMGEACRKFDTPVTGGNVSFYNQSADDGPVFPTPVIGMIGLLEEYGYAMTLDFRNEGDLIYLIGESRNDLGCSEYLTNVCGVRFSPAPHFSLEEEFELHETIRALIKENLIESAHDVSDGGLFTTLLESAMPSDLGFDISTDEIFRKDAFLFGESQSRVVVSVHPEKQDDFISLMMSRTIEFNLLGEVTQSNIIVDADDWGDVKEWKEVYENAIGNEMQQSVEV
ncbi:MAG TPA: phosphoribosylformylglycinamidine synthase subunit PurL [Chitinophagales bacterium]|nr:phosphoribosylformylglycinamidine synthase subunit PurL [Chitinophagales bacterium]